MPSVMILEEIVETLKSLDAWEDRYRFLIGLGRSLEPLEEAAHNDANKVVGCVSRVWIVTRIERPKGGEPVMTFRGDSDAHIVRGLVALILAIYSGNTATKILATDARDLFKELGFSAHLTKQRGNGLCYMIEHIKKDARRVVIDTVA